MEYWKEAYDVCYFCVYGVIDNDNKYERIEKNYDRSR